MFLNRVYPPAGGATGQLLAEIAPELVKAGWEVTVVTSCYDRDAPRSDYIDGVRIERIAASQRTHAAHWRRALRYLILYPAMLWRGLRLPSQDVVVTMTDPPMLFLLALPFKWFKRSRLVHWSHDIYPEAAEALGVLSNAGLVAGICRWLSNRALRLHDHTIVVGECMRERLVERGVGEQTIKVVPNWALGTRNDCVPCAPNAFRERHRLGERFVVMYSGNFGLAHSFEPIIKAAEQLQSVHPQILFLFVGEGPRLGWLKQEVGALGLSNVVFLPPQPLAELGETLTAADLHLATMKESLCGLVVPSKVYGILAAGRPCIFLGPEKSEVARIIRHHECGEIIVSPDGAKLAASLIDWVDNPEHLKVAGANGLRFAQTWTLLQAVQSFDRCLREAIACECAPETTRFVDTPPRPV